MVISSQPFTDRQEEIIPDEPPSYEAPPDYEEVIKIGMEHEMRAPRERHKQRHHRRRRDRSCSRADSNCTVSSTVPIHNFSDLPSTSAAAASVSNTAMELRLSSYVAQESLPETEGATQQGQDMAQQVIRATEQCGITGATQAPEAETTKTACNCQCKEKDLGKPNCPITLVAGNTNNLTPNSNSTTPQLEYKAYEFCDDSLNISLTLGIPQAGNATTLETNGDGSPRPKSAVHCTEQTYLKKSWFVINNDGKSYRLQRLRPTYSSPESFLSDWSTYGDTQNYGSILPHDQSFILSNNTSNFVSDISRDPSAYSIECRNDRMRRFNQINIGDNTVYDGSPSSPPDAGANAQLIQSPDADSDDDAGNISCFGTRNTLFRSNPNKARYTAVANGSGSATTGIASSACSGGNNHNRRRHARSKSFTNSRRLSSRSRSTSFRRSTSADLLMNFPPISSEIMNSDNDTTLYLI